MLPISSSVELIDYSELWLNDLVTMWRESFEEAVGVVDPHSLEDQTTYFLETVLPKNVVRLAVFHGQLVGFAAASHESISQLYVRVGCQRLGIGAMMLSWAKQQSHGSLWLYTFKRNTKAQSFYEKHGFTAVEYGFEPEWQLEDIKYFWTAVLPSP